jgi:putative tryptophan/tyrosine transport system substrate-binding protein
MRFLDDSWRSVLASTMRSTARVVASLAIALAFGAHSLSVAEAGDTRRIGYLTLDSAAVHAPFAAAFRQGLRESGFSEGENTAIEWRFAAYNPAALPGLVSELVDLRVELLVADGTQAALAAKRATRTIPIVVPTSGDLVRAGLVASLAHPGGNLTGLTVMSTGLVGKRLALLKEMAPRIHRVAVLVNPDNPNCEFQLSEAQAEAPGLELQLYPVSIRRMEDINRLLASPSGRVDALFITDDFVLDGFRARIGAVALQNRLPWICGYPMPEDKIRLMSYGPDLLNMFRRAASYVTRILGGKQPADLPVEQPTRFVLRINAKTASDLGITIPRSLLASADEVVR